MWLTGLMCGLRPGELAGLRWPFVDLDSDAPSIEVAERALEVEDKYVGQATPTTAPSKQTIGIHPLLVAALVRHRDEQRLVGLYGDESFAFCTRAGLGEGWTTYELRHSFVSLVSDQLDDLVKVADLAGHVDTRTTEGYRHHLRPSLPHAIDAWDQLLAPPDSTD
jgi:integrase